MAYLYRHIRLDKNEPFYIGIGNDENHCRAYNNKRRTKYWKNITSKTLYEVEILLDNLTWDEACSKEIEFIELYGRTDLNKGTLVNLTNGGEGKNGYKHSEDSKKLISKKQKGISKPSISISHKGRKIKWKNKIGISNSKPIIQIDPKTNIVVKEWNSTTEAQKVLGGSIANCLSGRNKTAAKYKWIYKLT